MVLKLQQPFYLLFKRVFFILLLISSFNIHAEDNAETNNQVNLIDAKFLGLKLSGANINSVRAHLWDIGGFSQARTTVRQRNVDKFFTWSSIRDSYHVTFNYNHNGEVVSLIRLYRPYSTLQTNKHTPISTEDVALELINELGQPTLIERKGWGGTPSYPSYIWQDEAIRITVDREGSEMFGNVFVKYELKNNPRYKS
jgi:hypothetical protein